MAASGSTTIQLYRTTTSGAAPTSGNLAAGELAININDADMAIYAKNNSGTVKRIINNPAGLKYPTADGMSGQAIVTDGSGNMSWATPSSLPSQTGNAGKFLTTDGTTASWGAVTGALATPTFSASSTTPTGGSTITVTITNYNSGYTYVIAVSGGTYTFNTSTGVVSWTVPNVASTTSYSLTAFAQSGVQSSFVGTQTVSVQASLVVDTPIAITNFAVYSANNGWAI